MKARQRTHAKNEYHHISKRHYTYRFEGHKLLPFTSKTAANLCLGRSYSQRGRERHGQKQTAGREQLGEFAPQFAALNDDVLFGEVWADEQALSAHDRSMITIAALIAMGSTEQLDAHLNMGKKNGITKDGIAAEITHLAFYAGWPKAWSAFNRAKQSGKMMTEGE